jgi:hypothetical protein
MFLFGCLLWCWVWSLCVVWCSTYDLGLLSFQRTLERLWAFASQHSLSAPLLYRLSEYYHSLRHRPLHWLGRKNKGADEGTGSGGGLCGGRWGGEEEQIAAKPEWDAHAVSSSLSLSPALNHELMMELYERFITSLALFNGCSQRFLAHLIPKCYTRHFRAGDTLVPHGAPNHFVFALVKGNVEVAEEQVQYGAGTFFGESNVMFVNPPPSRTSFVAATEVEAVLIHVADLRYALALYAGDRELVEERIRKKNDYKLGADEKHLTPANVNGSGLLLPAYAATALVSVTGSSGSGVSGGGESRPPSQSMTAAIATAAAHAGLCVPTEHLAIHVHHSSLSATLASPAAVAASAALAASNSSSARAVVKALSRPFPSHPSALAPERSCRGVTRSAWQVLCLFAVCCYWVVLPLQLAFTSSADEGAALDLSLVGSVFWRMSWVQYVLDALFVVGMSPTCNQHISLVLLCGF